MKKFLTAAVCAALLLGTSGILSPAPLCVTAANAQVMPVNALESPIEWELGSDGTLTIKAVNNLTMNSSSSIPWNDDREKITAVVIEPGVTHIPGYAFDKCTNLKTISIPDSVTSIGQKAFTETPWLAAQQAQNPLVIVNHIVVDGSACTGSVVIPEGTIAIGDQAFYIQDSITAVTIPDSVKSLGYFSFSGCFYLTDVTIPASLKDFGTFAFGNTAWVNAQKEKDPFVVVNGVLIDGTACTGAVTIPDSVTAIAGSAFVGNEEVTEVTIPDSVTSISNTVFAGCSKLTTVTIYNPQCEIGDYFGFFGTIKGYTGSTAQAFADQCSCEFISIGEAPEQPSEAVLGDITGDSAVNASDAANVLIAAAAIGGGKEDGLTDAQRKAADVNTDQMVNASDAAIILQYAAAVGGGNKDAKLSDFIH